MRGHIEKRGLSSYRIVVYIGKKNGRSQYLKETINGNQKQAEKRLHEIIASLEVNNLPPNKITLIDFINNIWLPGIKQIIKTSTYTQYCNCVKWEIVNSKISKKTMSAITPLDMENFKNKMSKNTNETIRSRMIIIRSVFNYALKLSIINTNPTRQWKLPPKNKHDYIVLEKEQIPVFLKTAKTDKYFIVYLLALFYGLRQGEILALKVSDIKKDKIIINKNLWSHGKEKILTTTKTNRKTRYITIDEYFFSHLVKFIEFKTYNEFVFTTRNGKVVHPSNLDRYFKNSLKKAGLPQMRFHDLRHSNASLLLAENVNLKLISERLDHSNIATTADIYSHARSDSQIQLNSILSSIFQLDSQKDSQTNSQPPDNYQI